MDLRRLRYFAAVAEERSISRAARRLHVAQPPLSVQLRELERELGVTLFTRHRRGVDLTEAGLELAHHARRLLGDVDTVAEAVRGIGQGASGRLTLAFVPALAATLLPDLLRRLRADLPAVALDLHEDDRDQVFQRVAGRRADAGLVFLSPAGPDNAAHDLELAVVDRVPMVAYVPEGHPMAVADRADLADLASHTLIVPSRSGRGGLVDGAHAACRAAGVTPAAETAVATVTTAVGLVAAGLGVALLPAGTPRLPGVAIRPLRRHVPPVETAVAWRRGEPASPVLSRFLRLALATPEPDVLGPDKARHGDPPD